MTVTGPVEPDVIGFTSCHEHLLIDLTPWLREPDTVALKRLARAQVSLETFGEITRDPLFTNVDNYLLLDAAVAAEELSDFRDWGGTCVVDLTNRGIGQDPAELRAIAARTGVQVVAGCGFYVQAAHPPSVAERDEDDVAAELVEALEVGIGGTDVRAGIIGEIGTSAEIHRDERKVLRASAKAQKHTGAAINVHTFLWEQQGLAALDILEEAGADLTRVIISHVDHGRIDLDYQVEMMRRGAVVEYDGFGKEWYVDSERTWFPRDVERVQAVHTLVERGFATQVVLGNDVCVKVQLTRYGGWGYRHLPKNVIPMMKHMGIPDDAIRTMTVLNPRRLLTIG